MALDEREDGDEHEREKVRHDRGNQNILAESGRRPPGVAERRHDQTHRSRCEHEGHERVVAEPHRKPVRGDERQSEHPDQHEKALAALSFECAEIDLESGEEHEQKQP